MSYLLLLVWLFCSCASTQEYTDKTIVLPERKDGRDTLNHYPEGWRLE